MFQNFYSLEREAQERVRSYRQQAEQERLARLALRGQEQRSLARRALSGLGERLILAGVGLTRRYGDCCAENRALLEHILSRAGVFPPDVHANL